MVFVCKFFIIELLKFLLGTNNQVIMRFDSSEFDHAVDLIAIGSVGTDSKLAGVYTCHRIPSFKNLEWSDVKIANRDGEQVSWIEIGDASRLVKIINSIIGLSSAVSDEINCDINVRITENEMNLSNDNPCSFSLPVRWFDSKWAAATISLPNLSTPRASLKLVAGLDQLAVILKRADRWRLEEWAIDILSVSCKEGISDLWDIEFLAQTSSPPNVSLRTSLTNCPCQSLNNVNSYESCEVSVNLGAATRALFVPLAENSKLSTASSGVSLIWIPEEALVGSVNWNSVGFGLIYTTIYIPVRLH